jgi:hypothetical protein
MGINPSVLIKLLSSEIKSVIKVTLGGIFVSLLVRAMLLQNTISKLGLFIAVSC